MKNNNKIDENDRQEILQLVIWFNLFIGIYNLHIYNEMSSLFHLVLGSLNVGVWVFFRDSLKLSFARLARQSNNEKR